MVEADGPAAQRRIKPPLGAERHPAAPGKRRVGRLLGRADERPAPDVAAHEPSLALYGGGDGLDLVRRAVAEAPRHLQPGGTLALEIGAGQAAAVRDLLAAAGFVGVTTERDLAGIERIVAGRLPETAAP